MTNRRLILTEALCERARAESGEYALRDLRQQGLSLRVRPTGLRTWIVRTRVDGKQVKQAIGTFPEMTLKIARQAAAAALLHAGEKRSARPPAPLFRAFLNDHLRRHATTYKPTGLRAYQSYVRNQLGPAFGKYALDAIDRPMIVRWFDRYSLESPGGANRALGILGQMFECAKTWGQLPSDWINPTIGIHHNRRRPIGSFLSEAQMARLGAVLSKRATAGCTLSALLHFLALTGCRVGEALALEWSDILPDRLRLRDSKTGARDVPIGSAVQHFLGRYRARPVACQSNAVFPIKAAYAYQAVQRIWYSVCRDAKLPPSLRIHDLRHSFASHAIMSGESLLTVSRLLGHSRIQTTARYAHLADDLLLDRAEQIGALIMAQAGA